MNNSKTDAIARIQNSFPEIREEDLRVMRSANIIPDGCPVDQIIVYLKVCQVRQLNPFLKQMYILPFNKRDKKTGKYEVNYAHVMGIDGMRVAAGKSGEYAGQDDIQWSGNTDRVDDTTTATATVYRIVQGHRCPFTATIRANEFMGTSPNWQRMPFHMIAKCAEAQALRKAFPSELGGIYGEEEIGSVQGAQVKVSQASYLNSVIDEVATVNAEADLQRIWNTNPQFHNVTEFCEAFNDRSRELELEKELSK